MKQRFMIKEASIAFTGHRNIAPKQKDKVRERLRKAVSLAYKEGKYQCICGMALGFDMLAAEEVLSLKARLPYLQLIAVVPFRGQNSRWDLAEQQRYDHILAKTDKVIVLSDTYYKGCLLRRNDFMLQHSNFVIAPKQKDKVRERLRKAVSLAYKEGKYQCICGMALGFDMLAAEEVLSLKARLPYLQLIAVVPFRGQNSRWDLAEQQRYDHILAKTDKVIVLSDTYYKGCLLRRNDFMLQHSNFVIAYYDGKQKGGTYYTCREARKRGMTVVNLF